MKRLLLFLMLSTCQTGFSVMPSTAVNCFSSIQRLSQAGETATLEDITGAYLKIFDEVAPQLLEPELVAKMQKSQNPFHLPEGVQTESATLQDYLKSLEELTRDRFDSNTLRKKIFDALEQRVDKNTAQEVEQKKTDRNVSLQPNRIKRLDKSLTISNGGDATLFVDEGIPKVVYGTETSRQLVMVNGQTYKSERLGDLNGRLFRKPVPFTWNQKTFFGTEANSFSSLFARNAPKAASQFLKKMQLSKAYIDGFGAFEVGGIPYIAVTAVKDDSAKMGLLDAADPKAEPVFSERERNEHHFDWQAGIGTLSGKDEGFAAAVGNQGEKLFLTKVSHGNDPKITFKEIKIPYAYGIGDDHLTPTFFRMSDSSPRVVLPTIKGLWILNPQNGKKVKTIPMDLSQHKDLRLFEMKGKPHGIISTYKGVQMVNLETGKIKQLASNGSASPILDINGRPHVTLTLDSQTSNTGSEVHLVDLTGSEETLVYREPNHSISTAIPFMVGKEVRAFLGVMDFDHEGPHFIRLKTLP